MSLGSDKKLSAVLKYLAETIDARAAEGKAETSYTAKLLAKGPAKTGKKLGEEGVELAMALVSESDDAVCGEAADLLYHLLVALRSRDISLDQVADVLIKREGLSGLDEKAARQED